MQKTDFYLKFDTWPFSNSLNNPKNGASRNLKKTIRIHSLDVQMTNLTKKNGWISLQPPIIEPKVLNPWRHLENSIFQGALLTIYVNQYMQVIHRWKGKQQPSMDMQLLFYQTKLFGGQMPLKLKKEVPDSQPSSTL